MKKLSVAEARRRLAITDKWSLIGSQNAPSANNTAGGEIAYDGQVIGWIEGYATRNSMHIGTYPDDQYLGEYRSYDSALNALARMIAKGEVRLPAKPKLADLIASGEFWDWTEVRDHEIDRAVAERTPCPECGGQCEYIGYQKGERSRGIAHCTQCDAAHEF